MAKRIERHQAGVKLEFDQTTPDQLASAVMSNIYKEVTYPAICTDVATRAASLLLELCYSGAGRRR